MWGRLAAKEGVRELFNGFSLDGAVLEKHYHLANRHFLEIIRNGVGRQYVIRNELLGR